MGFLKDWEDSGLFDRAAKNQHTIGVWLLGQHIRNYAAIEEFEVLISQQESFLKSIVHVESYLCAGQKDEYYDSAIVGLVNISAAFFGYDGKEYDYQAVRNFAQGLWGSLNETPETFRAQNMPVIVKLRKSLQNILIKDKKFEEKKEKKQIEYNFIKNNEKKKKKEKKQQQEVEKEAYEVSRKLNKNGTTTIRYSDKDRFNGYLNKKDQPYGLGTHYLFDGDKYVGEFKNGLYDGLGTYYFSNGTKHIGEFKKNNREGYGMEIDENGDIITGIWEDDEYLDE